MEVENSQLKEKLKQMLEWFHVFCIENGLRYYVLGGTMLGAVRHHGFIPWDDDIDIGMPRVDYCRLEQILKDNNSRYILETPNTKNADFFYPFSKLYDTETTLIENTCCGTKRGIYLDIFPLDGTGNTKDESLCLAKKVFRKRLLLLSMTTGIRKGRRLYKNAVVFLAGLIPNWLINRKMLLTSLNQMCTQKDFDQCEWVGNLMGNWMEREIMPRDVMGEPTVYTFENLSVWGPADYDRYLTSLYGNWRELPPIEKRKSHHDFLHIDLEHSYLE